MWLRPQMLGKTAGGGGGRPSGQLLVAGGWGAPDTSVFPGDGLTGARASWPAWFWLCRALFLSDPPYSSLSVIS